MDFLFNSYQYKKPFGGVATGQEVLIEFPIRYHIKASEVKIIIRKYSEDGEYLSVPFDFKETKDFYNIYTATFIIPAAGIYFYRFEVTCDDGIWFIGRGDRGQAVRRDHLPEWQLTVYDKDFTTPGHLKGGIIYHIFVDRFNTAGYVNFKKKGILKSWNQDVKIHQPDGTYVPDDFFGGNFKGIIEKLDYLESLNVTLLYLSPIFESSSNHRYDTGDYLKIDELLGSEEDFKTLISEAKKRGIGIMLDGVFNHSGADSVYFNKFGSYNTVGAYQSRKSPYFNWYTFKSFPDDYECWWGVTSVPTFNKSNKGYLDLVFNSGGVLDKWTRLGISGWRLDVVDELPENIVDRIREKVKSINPDVAIIGEVWEDASIKVSYGTMRPYLLGNQLDGTMNYPFREAIIRYMGSGNTASFSEDIMSILEHYPEKVVHSMMNLLSTHDTVRILNILSGVYADTKKERSEIVLSGEILEKAKRKLLCASSIQFMLPGVPSIFYGDEAGLQGYEDPLNRRPYPWGKEDKELVFHFMKLGRIRKEHSETMLGTTRFIEHPNLSIFLRETKGETIAVITNISGKNQVWTNPQKGVNLLNGQILEQGSNTISDLETLIIAY